MLNNINIALPRMLVAPFLLIHLPCIKMYNYNPNTTQSMHANNRESKICSCMQGSMPSHSCFTKVNSTENCWNLSVVFISLTIFISLSTLFSELYNSQPHKPSSLNYTAHSIIQAVLSCSLCVLVHGAAQLTASSSLFSIAACVC